MWKKFFTLAVMCLLLWSCAMEKQARTNVHKVPKKPLMGWASWNNYRVNINEGIIRAQADTMVARGLNKYGCQFINVDDGYFGGRNEKGELLVHKERFPNGMKSLADYIHSKG